MSENIVAFPGGYKVASKEGERIVPVAVVEKLYRLMSEHRKVAEVCKSVDLPAKAVKAIYRDLSRWEAKAILAAHEKREDFLDLCSGPAPRLREKGKTVPHGSFQHDRGPNGDRLARFIGAVAAL